MRAADRAGGQLVSHVAPAAGLRVRWWVRAQHPGRLSATAA
jgi:hypothetical protein